MIRYYQFSVTSITNYDRHVAMISYTQFIEERGGNLNLFDPTYLSQQDVYYYASAPRRTIDIKNKNENNRRTRAKQQTTFTQNELRNQTKQAAGDAYGEDYNKLLNRNDIADILRNLDNMRILDNAKFGAKKVRRAAGKVFVNKVTHKVLSDQRFQDICKKHKIPCNAEMAELLLCADDWSGIWDTLKKYGTATYDTVKDNWESLKNAAQTALSGNVVGGLTQAVNIIPKVYNDFDKSLNQQISSNSKVNSTKITTDQTAVGGTGNGNYAFYRENEPISNSNETSSIMDVSKGYINSLFSNVNKCDAHPSILPEVSMTKSVLSHKFVISLGAGDKAEIGVAPWNIFSAASPSSTTGTTRMGVFYTTHVGPIPVLTEYFTAASAISSLTALSRVRLNSVHVEIVPVFQALSTAFVANSAVFDSTITSDNTTANLMYLTPNTMALNSVYKMVSSNGITPQYLHYFCDSSDLLNGDGWLQYDVATNYAPNGPLLYFGVNGVTGTLSLQVQIRINFTAVVTSVGMITIPVWLAEDGYATSGFLDMVFNRCPHLRLADPDTLEMIANIIKNSSSRNADHIFSSILPILNTVSHNIAHTTHAHDNAEINIIN